MFTQNTLFPDKRIQRFLSLMIGMCVAEAMPLELDKVGAPDIETRFAQEVHPRLELPADESIEYVQLLTEALTRAGINELSAQYLVMVDRSPYVQAAIIFSHSPQGEWQFIGATPASTGKPGSYEHFITPLGVFEHSLANPDFRAEGTRNAYGILGYGIKGMRVFDFGWVMADRGWGAPARSVMRLQLHATDPDLLEPKLGVVASKGCIRIPASLNMFIDRYGLLDADYEFAVANGKYLWVLRPDRQPVQQPGRYLVVVDSQRKQRPSWSPLPSQVQVKQSKAMAAC
jgi:hypothetical protein